MKVIKVTASKSYDIYLGEGIINNIGAYALDVIKSNKIVLITDSNVDKLYSVVVENSLIKSGYKVYKFVFEAGEQSKNISTYCDILSFVAKSGLTRTDGIIALGGGVTGDMAGFVAATYMRGIPYIQVPTTLLAIIDSSVGGKTGVDLPEGKNLVGAFCQPDKVIADLSTLITLPEAEITNGTGELIKYGILMGEELWDRIESGENPITSERILELCISYKRDIVEADEKEQNVRKLLNLGHTAAHSIEKLSAYKTPHGIAVGTGIAVIALSAKNRGELSETSYNKITAVLKREKMPLTAGYSAVQLADAALNDKKSDGAYITIVTIKDIGNCRLTKITQDKLKEYFE